LCLTGWLPHSEFEADRVAFTGSITPLRCPTPWDVYVTSGVDEALSRLGGYPAGHIDGATQLFRWGPTPLVT